MVLKTLSDYNSQPFMNRFGLKLNCMRRLHKSYKKIIKKSKYAYKIATKIAAKIGYN